MIVGVWWRSFTRLSRRAKYLVFIQNDTKEGKIKVVRTRGGRRRIPESLLGVKEDNGLIMSYARVSSCAQKDDLERRGNKRIRKGKGLAFFKKHEAEIIILNEKDKTPKEELI